MACLTCGHTMEWLAEAEGYGIFWCPRCGSILHSGLPLPCVPKLVERCRDFGVLLRPGPTPFTSLVAAWQRLGISESINPPERRPK